tara:strand:- start:11690 stop:12832 length:1143 start_codon:yes stop_codon:yes gene_type:complete
LKRTKICIVSPGYPSDGYPFYVFVKNLVNHLSTKGVDCYVFSPQSISKIIIRGAKKSPVNETQIFDKNPIFIYRPFFMSFSNSKILSAFSDFLLSKLFYKYLKSKNFKFDAIYCHFWQSAFISFKHAKKFNIPIFVACGEDKIPSFNRHKNSKLKLYNYLSGVICVSTKNQLESIEKGLTPRNKTIVIPNATDLKLFNKTSTPTLRKKLKINTDDFVVIFVGAFIKRKGISVLDSALKFINDDKIKCIYIGSGPYKPSYKNILFVGKVNNDDLPNYLSIADVFILPTLSEGCCNSIIEAMACELPIISSNRNFNFDILDKSNSILINPENINEVVYSLNKLRSNKKLLKHLSIGSYNKSRSLGLDSRASKIIDFIKSKLN